MKPRAGKPSLSTVGYAFKNIVWPRRRLVLLGLVLIVINRLSGLVLPGASKYLLDNAIALGDLVLMRWILLGMVGAVSIQAATSYLLTRLLSVEAQLLISELRSKVQRHVIHLPVSYFSSTKTGVLVSRIMTDVEGVRNLIGTGLVQFAGGLLTAVIALVVLIRISPLMTGVAFAFLIVFGGALRKAFRTIRPIFRERGKINAEVTGRLAESLGGVRVVKGYHAEAREHEVFSRGVQRLLENVFRTLTSMSVLTSSSTALMGVVGALVMFLGARQVLDGSLTVGGFFTYTLFLGFLVAPLFQVVGVGTQLTEAIAGLDRTREVLREIPEDQDARRTVALPGIEGAVEFEGVRFAYEANQTVLHGISFRAEPGTVTALVGSSGSGKSTVIGLIAAFYVPQEGRVLVDGMDLAAVRLDSYRSHLGVVLQDSFLFDGTIRENVTFSLPGASDEQIHTACRIARVDEFAERFEKKYDTVIGERGVKLSGGQRQRVSIARAMLADPRILILDEATSSLDSESEQLIQEGLAYLMRGRTTFVIAHRLSTIRRADQILVLEAGRIVERGTHDSLLAARGRYYELYTRQHGLESNLFLAPGEGEARELPRSSLSGEDAPAGADSDAMRLFRRQSL